MFYYNEFKQYILPTEKTKEVRAYRPYVKEDTGEISTGLKDEFIYLPYTGQYLELELVEYVNTQHAEQIYFQIIVDSREALVHALFEIEQAFRNSESFSSHRRIDHSITLHDKGGLSLFMPHLSGPNVKKEKYDFCFFRAKK